MLASVITVEPKKYRIEPFPGVPSTQTFSKLVEQNHRRGTTGTQSTTHKQPRHFVTSTVRTPQFDLLS